MADTTWETRLKKSLKKIGGRLFEDRADYPNCCLGLDFTGVSFPKTAIELLREYPQLKALRLRHISEDDFRELASLDQVETLLFFGSIPANLSQEIKKLRNLRSLHFLGVPINDLEFNAAITACLNLTSLSVDENPNLTNEALRNIGLLANLEKLYVVEIAIDDLALEFIRKAPSLRSLGLGNTDVTDEGLPNLSELKNLEVLDLSGTWITDQGIPALMELDKLKCLGLAGCNISSKALQYLKSLRNLQNLDLIGLGIADSDLKKFLRDHPNPNLKVRLVLGTYFTASGEIKGGWS